MRTRFNTKWTKHLQNEAERLQFEKTVRASRTALDRLAQLLIEEVEALNNQEANISDYDSAAWSHKQAHRNGQRAFAKTVLDLLTFSKE